jgi:hypothetical protein
MIGSIGVDIQGSRAAVCLMEWAGGQVRQGPVGDGRRILIPVAATPAAWGSAAAEAALDAVPASSRPADMLYAWRQDAWSPEFLAGLHRRLLAFLGQAQPEGFRSHQVCVCADPASAGGWATAAELLGQAGLPGTEQVQPTDALLCRWLSETPEPPSGPVLAVACSETVTILGLYSVEIDDAPVVRADGETRIYPGSGPWVTEIAADALRQCRPGFPARALLGLLDGVDEFAAMLRVSTGDTWVEWAGPLSQYMFEPLRASRSEVAARTTAADYTRPVASAVHSVLNGVAGRVTFAGGRAGCRLALRRRRAGRARDHVAERRPDAGPGLRSVLVGALPPQFPARRRRARSRCRAPNRDRARPRHLRTRRPRPAGATRVRLAGPVRRGRKHRRPV